VKDTYLSDLLAHGELPDPSDRKYFVESGEEDSKKRKAADIVRIEKPWIAKRRKLDDRGSFA